MAASDSFAALSRHSRRGVSPTLGSDGPAGSMAAPMSIGAVDDQTDSPGIPFPPVARNAFAGLHRGTMGEDEAPAPRAYEQESSPFAGLERGGPTLPERAARKDVNAIKVVTRLVQGMAFKPGSSAPSSVKSAALREQLIEVHRHAQTLAQAAAPQEAHRAWVVRQCSEAVADLVARRNERGDQAGLPAQLVDGVCEVLRGAAQDGELSQALDGLQASQYVEATDASVARDRLSVSLAAAIWELHERVLDGGCLHGMTSVQLVQALSEGMVRTASAATIQIASRDMQTAHLQGSIRRLGALIGAEYSSRTKAIVAWIEGDGVDQQGRLERERAAQHKFRSEVLPEILSDARKNFIAIEKLAPKLLEEARLEQQARSSEGRADAPHGD